MKYKTFLLSACALNFMAVPAYAVDRTWDAGAGTTNWLTAVNWSANTLPTASDNALINMISGVTVTAPGAVSSQLRLGTTSGGTGNLTISGGGVLTASNIAYVGYSSGTTSPSTPGGTGNFTVTGAGSQFVSASTVYLGNGINSTGNATVSNGGAITSGGIIIANTTGSTGSATVTNANSSWAMRGSLTVGNGGTGNLTISNGGSMTVFTSDTATGHSYIGDNAGTTGTVLVDGAGSLLTIRRNNFYIGNSGNGTVTVQNGGAVNAVRTLIGFNAGGTGTLNVDGANSIYTYSGTNSLSVGSSGNGTINITNGGTVSAINAPVNLGAGDIAASGTVLVSGANSKLVATQNTVNIGALGSGTMRIDGGGEVIARDVVIGSSAGSSGILIIGAAAIDPATAAGTLNTPTVTFGSGTGSIVFNHTDTNYDFTADIIGNGTLNFVAGTTNLTGDNSAFTGAITGVGNVSITSGTTSIITNSSAFSGSTDVTGGILAVNGALGGTTTVSGTGRVQGNANLGDLVINNGGAAAPGNSIGTVNAANVTFNPGATYEVEVNSAGQSDLIDATGTATLNGGTVLAIPFPDVRTSNPYTILTAAGGITGAFDGSADNYLFLNTLLTYDLNNVYLTITADDAALVAAAQTPNQKAVMQGTNMGGTFGNAALDALYAAPGVAALQEGLDLLSGEVHASLAGALIQEQRVLRNAVIDPAPSGFRTLNDGDSRVWIRGLGVRGQTQDTGNTAQMKQTTGGVLAGVEKFNDDDRYGFALGATSTDLKQDDVRSEATSDNYHAMVYGSKKIGSGVNVSGGAAYTWHEINSERNVVLTGFDERSKADYSAQSSQIFAEISKELKSLLHPNGPSLTPYAQASYTIHHTDGFHEDGEAGLHGHETSNAIGSTAIGMRYRQEFQVIEDETVTIQAGAAWQHNMGDTDPEQKMNFEKVAASNFTVEGAPVGSEAILYNIGATYNISKALSLGLSLEGIQAQDYSEQGGFGRLQWQF